MHQGIVATLLLIVALTAAGCHRARRTFNHYVADHDELAAEATPEAWRFDNEWTFVATRSDGTTDEYEFRITDRPVPRHPGYVELYVIERPDDVPDMAIAKVDGRNLQVELILRGVEMPVLHVFGGELIGDRFVGARRVARPAERHDEYVAVTGRLSYDAYGEAPPEAWAVGSEWQLHAEDADGDLQLFEFHVTDRHYRDSDRWVELVTVMDTRPGAPPRAIATAQGRHIEIDLAPESAGVRDRLSLKLRGSRLTGERQIDSPDGSPKIIPGVSGRRSHDPSLVPGPMSGLRRKALAAEPTPPEWATGSEWSFGRRGSDGTAVRFVVRVTDRPVDLHRSGHCVELDAPEGEPPNPFLGNACVEGRVLGISLGPELNHGYQSIEGELRGSHFVGIEETGSDSDYGSSYSATDIEGWRSR